MSNSSVQAVEIVRAGVEDVEAVAPLFDAYLQFYKLPSNEEAARRFLHARLVKSEAVILLALEERRGKKHARACSAFFPASGSKFREPGPKPGGESDGDCRFAKYRRRLKLRRPGCAAHAQSGVMAGP